MKKYNVITESIVKVRNPGIKYSFEFTKALETQFPMAYDDDDTTAVQTVPGGALANLPETVEAVASAVLHFDELRGTLNLQVSYVNYPDGPWGEPVILPPVTYTKQADGNINKAMQQAMSLAQELQRHAHGRGMISLEDLNALIVKHQLKELEVIDADATISDTPEILLEDK